MKLLYATDLHGDTLAYDRLVQFARTEQIDALVLGGDLFAYHPTAAPQLAFAEGPFRSFLDSLHALDIPLLAIAGNVDRPLAISHLRRFEDAGLLRMLDLQPYRLASPRDPAAAVYLAGFALVTPSPFRVKDHERRDLAADAYAGPWPIFVSSGDPAGDPVEAPDDRLDRLPSLEEELAGAQASLHPYILVAHCPPWGGPLDLIRSGLHAGSHAVRQWIETQQPALALHGHIHEAPELAGQWTETIGRTVCANPGPAMAGAFQAVVVETMDLPGGLRHTRYGPISPVRAGPA